MLIQDGERLVEVPELPEQITEWLDLMCREFPAVMTELLQHEIGKLDTWFEADDPEGLPKNGCLVGSTALMMSKVLASTCSKPVDLTGAALSTNQMYLGGQFYLTEMLVRCSPQYQITDEEWKILEGDRLYRRDNNTYLRTNFERSTAALIQLGISPDRMDAIKKILSIYSMTQSAGVAAPDYQEELSGITMEKLEPVLMKRLATRGLDSGEYYRLYRKRVAITHRLAVLAFKTYIRQRLEAPALVPV